MLFINNVAGCRAILRSLTGIAAVSLALSASAETQQKMTINDPSIQAVIEKVQYQFEESKGGYVAQNPQQGYQAHFDKNAVTLKGHGDNQWNIAMRLAAIGSEKQRQQLNAEGSTKTDAQMEHHWNLCAVDQKPSEKCDAGAVTEWYKNTSAGLEQGFTLERAPDSAKNSEQLSVWLALNGDLKAEAANDGQSIALTGKNTRVNYQGLKA